MTGKHKTTDMKLELGMLEVDISLPDDHRKLNTKTRAAAHFLAQDGLGIINLRELAQGRGYHIEHTHKFTSESIAKVFGYLAMEGLGGDIRFVRPDGTEHPLQLDDQEVVSSDSEDKQQHSTAA